ncbi:MAG: flagellar hook-associated protein FlgK [Oscillospiraceae bacterium]|nr:flagellar hook-associated protein FlgK [Oscillospiraceae bacterium]
MRPTFLGFETQKRTLQVAQKSLDIAGNNVSNINTIGYTRQRVDLYSMYVSGNQSLRWCSNTNNLSLNGQGVNAYGVSQIRDQYIDKRYRENTAVEAETEKTVNILSDIEDVLDNIDTDGLQYFTEQYFKALQVYSVERPDAAEVATIAANSAVNLCRLLNDYSVKLQEVEDTYVGELEDTVGYVNNLLGEINTLNDRIARELINYPEEYGPNELYDQLNMYIDELANYGDISVTKNDNGTYSVDMAGVNIIDGEKFKANYFVMTDYEKAGGQAVLNFESGEEVNLHAGILKSYTDMLNGNGVYATGRQNGSHGIAYYQSAIDEFARTLANTFNSANGADEDPARQMFVGYPSGGTDPTADENKDGVLDGGYSQVLITAGNIHVSTVWKENPTMIGMVKSIDETTGKPVYGYDEVTGEDGTVKLQNTNVLYLLSRFESGVKFGNENDFKGDVYQYISFISDRLAETISYETSRNETAKSTVDTLLDARDEVSGVQMDEEGINMLNYQKWYSASSRMLTALDDALDKLINGTGRVGL